MSALFRRETGKLSAASARIYVPRLCEAYSNVSEGSSNAREFIILWRYVEPVRVNFSLRDWRAFTESPFHSTAIEFGLKSLKNALYIKSMSQKGEGNPNSAGSEKSPSTDT